ncbi:MAG: hypothetical protein ACXADH_18060 [Candidatus Kariarchaeaceae archaeon]|jgi:hypothetical protein
MADTAKFEAATIACYYQAINDGQSTTPGLSPEMTKAMDQEYPNMSTEWREGILAGADALMKYIGHTPGTKDGSWLYAHYDGRVKTIPAGDQTDIINYMWDSFTKEQRAVFSNKKDSWNTADVYMVKKNDNAKMKRDIDGLKETFADLDPEIYIGTLNRYMSQRLSAKTLLPISLKQKTRGADVKITPTNLELGPDGLEVKSGSIETPLKTVMDVTDRGGIDFAGNSLRFAARFEAGTYAKKYSWESKGSSKTADATEPRDLVLNNKGKYTTATARNGSIPGPKMAELVKKYTGQDINHNIPMSRKLNAQETKYWQDYIEDIINHKRSNIPIDLGTFKISGKKVSPADFIQGIALMDQGKPGGKNMDQKIRAKLRHLRYIKMFYEADKKGLLGELISHAYFLSSKMNISQQDLAGPFIKVQ